MKTMKTIKITENQLNKIICENVENHFPSTNSASLLKHFEEKYGVTLSDNGEKWFMGVINNSQFGLTMDNILEHVVFQYCGIERFPIGKGVANEWDELDSIIRVMIEKTGVGKDLLARFRSLKTHEDFISPKEMKSIEEKLKYWPNIYNEFVRCYNIFTKIAPEIYQKIDALKNYKDGIPALEFCFLVGCVKERGRMKLDAAINNVLYGVGKNLLPTFS